MQVRQYAYFMIRSETVALPDITAQLGMEPDSVSRRGSRIEGPPPRPLCNIWRLNSGCPDTVLLDEHLAALLHKLEPIADNLRAFLASFDATGCIEVVRNFPPGAEDDEILNVYKGPKGAERLRGQHPLLGFHLDQRLIQLAAHSGIDFDYDEDGDEHE